MGKGGGTSQPSVCTIQRPGGSVFMTPPPDTGCRAALYQWDRETYNTIRGGRQTDIHNTRIAVACTETGGGRAGPNLTCLRAVGDSNVQMSRGRWAGRMIIQHERMIRTHIPRPGRGLEGGASGFARAKHTDTKRESYNVLPNDNGEREPKCICEESQFDRVAARVGR